METEIFGLLGLALIAIAWLPGIVDTIKSGKPGMKKRFMLLYFLGSASLSYYAFVLNSISFLALNSIAALVPIIHLFFYIKKYGIKNLLTPTSEL
ncbi:MAG TPA: hypothetical protein VFF13_06145 [archaeon]|nr:hypothetical protein [archaeon]